MAATRSIPPALSAWGQRLRAVLDSPRLPLLAALLAVVLTGPSLAGDLATEDYAQLDVVTHSNRPFGPPLNLFGHDAHWTPADTLERNQDLLLRGYFPWIADPSFDASFFRPLASLTHRIDYRFLASHPALMHAESILWYAALAAAVALLYRALVSEGWAAGAAALLYAADDAHGQPVGWLINRNGLMASLFSVLALLAYDRFRRRGSLAGAGLTVVLWLLALGSGEFALAASGYFVAYGLFVDDAVPWKRLLSSLLFLVPTAAFLAYHHSQGFGTIGSGLYLDPMRDPRAYLGQLPERAAVLLLGQFGAPFSDLWAEVSPYAQGLLVFTAAAFLWLLGWLVLPLVASNRRMRFWAAGTLLSLPPVAATFPEDRLLLITGIGAFPIVVTLLTAAAASWTSGTAPRKWALRGVGAAFVALHVVAAPLLLPYRALRMHRFQGSLDRAVDGLRAALRGTPGEALILVNAETFYAPGILAATEEARGRKALPRLFTLAGTPEPIALGRPDVSVLEVRIRDGFSSPPFNRIHRGPRLRFIRGQVLDFKGVEVTITEVSAEGDPLAARFTFALPLESPRYHFVVLRDGRYEAFTLPRIGEHLSVGGA